MLSAGRRGPEPTFDRLMLEFDEPAMKSLLVELDESATAKGLAAADPGPVGRVGQNHEPKGG